MNHVIELHLSLTQVLAGIAALVWPAYAIGRHCGVRATLKRLNELQAHVLKSIDKAGEANATAVKDAWQHVDALRAANQGRAK